jgi:hypothetical protein
MVGCDFGGGGYARPIVLPMGAKVDRSLSTIRPRDGPGGLGRQSDRATGRSGDKAASKLCIALDLSFAWRPGRLGGLGIRLRCFPCYRAPDAACGDVAALSRLRRRTPPCGFRPSGFDRWRGGRPCRPDMGAARAPRRWWFWSSLQAGMGSVALLGPRAPYANGGMPPFLHLRSGPCGCVRRFAAGLAAHPRSHGRGVVKAYCTTFDCDRF